MSDYRGTGSTFAAGRQAGSAVLNAIHASPLLISFFLEIIFAPLGIVSMVELYYYNCGDIDFVTEVGDMGNVSPLDFLENDTMH